jgi:tetratricopeptide (TPR) repeat protein
MHSARLSRARGSATRGRYLSSGTLLFAALVASSCSDPEKQKVQHVARGDQYAADKKDDFAVVEYASAVQIDPKFGEARWKLAQTYERMQNLRAAIPEFIRAADASPDNREAQLKAAEVLLQIRRYDDAKARTTLLIQRDAKDVDALLLQANAMAALKDTAGALARIEDALKIKPRDSRIFVNLGAVRMQSGDAALAEAAYKQAIALDVSSVNARLAFATFLSTTKRMVEAEATLKEVLATEPRNLVANRMLSALYLATQRTGEAEQPLITVAEASGDPVARLQLADYYVGAGRTGEATKLLTELSAQQATSADAETRLAALEYSQNRGAEAHKRLDALLVLLPKHATALTMKAQWLTIENKLDEALGRAIAAVAADAQSAAAFLALATVQERRGEVTDAIASYTEVARLSPRDVRAQIALSRLNLSRDPKLALQHAETARRMAPESAPARVALARSLMASGDVTRADTEVAELAKAFPDVAEVHALLGTLHAARRNTIAARTSYERALDLSPGLVEAVGALTFLDLQAKAPAQAIARLETHIAKDPGNARLLGLVAQAYTSAGDSTKAEQALRKAVSVDPRSTASYEQLARLYMQQRRVEEARLEFEGMAKRDPSAVGAKTMVGMLLEAQGRRQEAVKWYEGIVNRPEEAPIAANNLAFIYADQGTNLDIALQLATSAKPELPNDPSVDDTIGWVYYKKNLPSLAVGPLQESLKRLPDNAEVLYHLGLTYAKLGDKVRARDALGRAVKIDPKVGGGEAERVLASVSQ